MTHALHRCIGVALGLALGGLGGAVWPLAALGTPENGFALAVGSAGHSAEGTFTSGPAAGTTVAYTTTGFGFGIEYQFVLLERIGIYPMLQTSGESVADSQSGAEDASHGMVGVGVRYWFVERLGGDLYLGAHVGGYSEALSSTSGSTTVTNSADGGGIGFQGGFENDAGFLARVQLDGFTVEYDDTEIDISGIRVSLGYRWK